uniref:Uncharacterized protein n=1 Tax=Calcidiscus leptoporus TaxID=127549 RepID=A0A7S0J4G1_9EUKA|mmetsp:Transcript_38400/g.89826  ORF Transcript_38400/g.89826 Transcript_38400/m.89826 type:complete len:127 (+) Transcript_38400:142-522(+)|eukprot:CAMPEP_0119373712 /NCGR_PEP_ID=MMETSP1334-20130426/27373_1 /TAXON_ID=127549 /ORGANISM="Calcidiscus leptoporus, Strain RCC1130" /LENGTH=126 /DNA_ID=CAMNT_0007391571 /DNA_START=142 /DNA_END=522 /DNA_ORIENTATION=+
MLKFFLVLIGVALITIGAWLLRHARLRELEYARVQLYEDAEKPFAYNASESDSLMAEPVRSDSLDDVLSKPPPAKPLPENLLPAKTPPSRTDKSTKSKSKKKCSARVDTTDVNAVQAMIKQELQGA